MLTVLTIAYNQINYTQMLLKSLANPLCADYPFQIVFIDNGSRDGTRELIHHFDFKENPNYVQKHYFAFKSNRGVAAAINQGFQMAQTEFVLQADNDVVFGPESLSILMSWIQKYPQGIISPNWPWIQKKLGTLFFQTDDDLTADKMERLRRTGLRSPLEAFRATGSCWLCAQTVFNALGGWDTEYKNICASDDFLWRIALTGMDRYTVPCPVYHPGQITRCSLPKNSEQQEKDLQRFFQRWGAHPEDKQHLRELQRQAGCPVDPPPALSWWDKIRSLRKEKHRCR